MSLTFYILYAAAILGILIIIALTREADPDPVWWIADASVPDELVELGVDADVLGAHHGRGNLPDGIDCLGGALPEGLLPDVPQCSKSQIADLGGSQTRLLCDCSAQLQGVPNPPGPKCRKSPKKVVPGLSARSAKKVPKKSKKSRKSLSLALFRDFFGFFGTFLTLRADRPGTTFLRLFRHFGPGGSGTPCNWALQSQRLLSNLVLGCLQFLRGCALLFVLILLFCAHLRVSVSDRV